MTTSVLLQPGMSFPSTGYKLTTTSKTDIYTQSEGFASAATLLVCNTAGSAVTLDVYWYDSSALTEFQLFSQKSIGGNTTEELSLGGVGLFKGDIIRATASTGNALQCVLTVADTPGRNAG